MPVVVLSTVAGLHVPVIPFVDVVGRTGAALPAQIGLTEAKVGVMVDAILTVNVVVVAHCPAFGVNV